MSSIKCHASSPGAVLDVAVGVVVTAINNVVLDEIVALVEDLIVLVVVVVLENVEVGVVVVVPAQVIKSRIRFNIRTHFELPVLHLGKVYN